MEEVQALPLSEASGGFATPPSATEGPALPQEASSLPSCAPITAGNFDGKRVADALDVMATGKILSILPGNSSGRTVKMNLVVEPNWYVFFKPRHRVHLFTRPQGEVGAFRVNRLLGMNHVPPAVVRTLDGSVIHSAFKRRGTAERLDQLEREVLSPGTDDLTGALLLWVHGARNFEPSEALLEKMKNPRAVLSPDEEALVWDLSWMVLLDHLTNNYDRHTGGNILRAKDGRLVFIDNGAAFGPDRDWKRARRQGQLQLLARHAPAFTAALRRLEPRVMAACAGDVLSARDIDGVLSRRDELVAHLAGLERGCPTDCRIPRELEAP